MKFSISILLFSFLLFSFHKVEDDKLYQNYRKAVNQASSFSTFKYFTVIKIKDKSGICTEQCTKGNFLLGAIHMEYRLKYTQKDMQKAYEMALANKDRTFEFKRKKARENLMGPQYSQQELKEFEIKMNVDSIAEVINRSDSWKLWIPERKEMNMLAHALFNRVF